LISNLAEGDVDFADINYWSWDIGNLSGGCALAFTVHTVVTALMKPNINQDKNVRDLGLSYLLGFCLYIFIGNMGAIAISNK
jgi:Ca2+/Na+ antiporter